MKTHCYFTRQLSRKSTQLFRQRRCKWLRSYSTREWSSSCLSHGSQGLVCLPLVAEQLVSSDLSRQWGTPSQRKSTDTHAPCAHCHSLAEQAAGVRSGGLWTKQFGTPDQVGKEKVRWNDCNLYQWRLEKVWFDFVYETTFGMLHFWLLAIAIIINRESKLQMDKKSINRRIK